MNLRRKKQCNLVGENAQTNDCHSRIRTIIFAKKIAIKLFDACKQFIAFSIFEFVNVHIN